MEWEKSLPEIVVARGKDLNHGFFKSTDILNFEWVKGITDRSYYVFGKIIFLQNIIRYLQLYTILTQLL